MSSYYFYFIGFFRVKFWCISQNSIVFPHSFGLPTGWWSGGHPSLCESVGKYFLCWGKSICWSFDDGGESQLLSQTPLSPFACPRLWPHHHCICILYFYFVFCFVFVYCILLCIFILDFCSIINIQTVGKVFNAVPINILISTFCKSDHMMMMMMMMMIWQNKFIVDILVPLKSRWLWALCPERHYEDASAAPADVLEPRLPLHHH